MPTKTVEITLLRSDTGPVSKSIRLGPGGSLDKTPEKSPSSGSMSRVVLFADASTPDAANTAAEALGGLIGSIKSNEAIIHGRLRPGLKDKVSLILKDADTGKDAARAARTNENLIYAPGQPGPALLDYDRTQIQPEAEKRLVAAGGFVGALCKVMPGIGTTAAVVRASTGAGLFHSETKAPFLGGGLHVYLMVEDNADIPRFLKALHERFILAGYGWAVVDKTGRTHIRSPVDTAVGSPSRIIYEAAPTLTPPLAQKPRPVQVAPGTFLDTRRHCPDLTPEDRARLAAIERDLASARAEDAERARAAYEAAQAAKHEANGMDPEDARAAAASASVGDVLTGPAVLHFDKHGPVSVAALLLDPALAASLDGATLRDPHEPNTGPNKAVFFAKAGRLGLPAIYTQIHGGALIPLRLALDEARVALAAEARRPGGDPSRMALAAARVLVQPAAAGGYEPADDLTISSMFTDAAGLALPEGTKAEKARAAALLLKIYRTRAAEARAAFDDGALQPGETIGGAEVPRGFAQTEHGWTAQTQNGPLPLAGPFDFLGGVSAPDGTSHGTLISWRDQAGRVHSHVVTRAGLLGDTALALAPLADRGLWIAPDARSRVLLILLLNNAKPTRLIVLARRSGFVPEHAAFLLPGGAAIGPDAAKVALAPGISTAALSQAGTLDGWKNGIAAPAIGNATFAFGLCLPFAAALADLLGEGGIIVNLVGASSSGKTTSARAAASAWGSPTAGAGSDMGTWRGTDNGIEGRAAATSGRVLILDELKEAPPEVVSAVAYSLNGGAGKARAARDGSARALATWFIYVLSTGEIGLYAALARAKLKPDAGQGIRFIDLPATPDGSTTGAFPNLHGAADGGTFARALDRAAREHHGHAGAAFVTALMTQPEPAQVIARAAIKEAEAALRARVPADLEAQAGRALTHFARIAAAGEMAAAFGVLPWLKGEATEAAALAFLAWLGQRQGGGADAEGAAAVQRVRDAIELHPGRFVVMNHQHMTAEDREAARIAVLCGEDEPAEDTAAPDPAGERRSFGEVWGYSDQRPGREGFAVSKAGWDAIHRGHDAQAAARALAARGLLRREGDGRDLTIKMAMPDASRPRFYFVRAAIREGGD